MDNKTILVIIFSPFLILNVQVLAADTMYLGGVPVQIAAPEGYFRLDGRNDKLDALMLTLVPDSNRLLAAYGSEDDLAEALLGHMPEFKRCLYVEAPRNLEEMQISSAQFQLRKHQLRNETDQLLKKARPKIKEALKRFSGAMSAEIQGQIELNVGEMIPLGVFEESSNFIILTILMKTSATSGQLARPEECVYVFTTCVIHLRGKILYLYAYSTYEDKEDIDWARESVKKWCDSILSLNASQANPRESLSAKPSQYTSSRGARHVSGGIISKAFLGGIVMVLLYIIRGVRRGKTG